jgi:sulfide:quinone oxidoreductase
MQMRIVILGCATGGTLPANRLNRVYGESAQIIMVDRDDRHVYQPGLLRAPFGADPDGIVRSRRAQLREGIEFQLAHVDRVVTGENAVDLDSGESISYDMLVT